MSEFKFDNDLQIMLIHVVAGGFLGFYSSTLSNNFIALGLAVVLLIALGQIIQRVYKIVPGKKSEKGEAYGFKWWLSHGVYPFLIFWLFMWIVFYNL